MFEMKIETETRLELYYDSTIEPYRTARFDRRKVLEILEDLRKIGVTVQIFDTAGWETDMLRDVYLHACGSAISRKFRIRGVFGAGRDGRYFGRQVPALLCIEGGRIASVYPCDEKGKKITIEDGLTSLKLKLSRGGARVAR